MRGVPPNKIGKCARCGQSFQAKGPSQKYCDGCRPIAYREAVRICSASYYRRYPERVKLANKVARAKRHDYYLAMARRQHRRTRERLRTMVLRNYSGAVPRCACCGEREQDFLTIDHIEGRARDAEKKFGIPRAGYPLYRWLRRNRFPIGFQVLCANCNISKGKHGKCTHTTKLDGSPTLPSDSEPNSFNSGLIQTA